MSETLQRETVVVKLGGSLITEKTRSRTLRGDVLERLAQEVARARATRRFNLLLSHGSGSFGHTEAARAGLDSGVTGTSQLPGVGRTQDAAHELHRRVVAALRRAGVEAFSLVPSSFLVASAGRPVSVLVDPLVLALGLGLVPVTCGDVVMDRELGASVCSTERVLEALAHRLPEHGFPLRRALWLGETDGVYDREGEPIARVTPESFDDVLSAVGPAAGTDVTGGMRHRLETARALARLGIPSWLLNGLRPGLLERALRGETVAGTEVTGFASERGSPSG